jgi:hypothetical protein
MNHTSGSGLETTAWEALKIADTPEHIFQLIYNEIVLIIVDGHLQEIFLKYTLQKSVNF